MAATFEPKSVYDFTIKDAKGNDFDLSTYKGKWLGNQELGSNEEIVQFACTRFKAKYLILDKVDVNGDKTAPIYKFLKSSKVGLFGDGELCQVLG